MTKVKAYLVSGRVVVFNTDDARRLYSNGFYGKPLGIPKPQGADFDAPLELDLIEALYLAEKGVIDVYDTNGRRLSIEDLRREGENRIHNFSSLYRVYKELRESGYIVRSGLKFGAEFTVYEKGPGIDHAPYLVHVVSVRDRVDPLEIVRAGRLSHSVRKKFILAIVDEATGRIDYIAFEWAKP